MGRFECSLGELALAFAAVQLAKLTQRHPLVENLQTFQL
jgi:hypothetical protein